MKEAISLTEKPLNVLPLECVAVAWVELIESDLDQSGQLFALQVVLGVGAARRHQGFESGANLR